MCHRVTAVIWAHERCGALGQDSKIQAYLKKISESNFLGRGARRSALLAYLLEAEASGKGDKIKAYSIGVDVFEKSDDFDPTVDSSVRVEIGRLRTAIALFEASEWADTAIKVEIPVGTYRPIITDRQVDAEAVQQTRADGSPTRPVSSAPMRKRYLTLGATCIVAAALLFWGVASYWARAPSLTSGPPITLTIKEFEGDALGKDVSTLVQDSFSNNAIVALKTTSLPDAAEGNFSVTGSVTRRDDRSFVRVKLTEQASQKLVWSHYFELDTSTDLRTQLNAKLNGELETRLLGEAKSRLEKMDVALLSPEQMFLLGTWVSGPAKNTLSWETERVTLMQLALEKDPDFGPAHSVLADKYGFLANVHPDWNTEEYLNLSRFHAERAIELSPLDANAMFNVAQSYWHAGRHGASQRMFHRVTELDQSNSLARFFTKLLPYWCADVPNDVMLWATDFDASLSRDNPIRWIVLTWIAQLHTNRGEYDLAARSIEDAAQIFQVAYTYMIYAMLLVKDGQPDAARSIIQRQNSNWPNAGFEHFINTTVPRLCLEQPDAERFTKDYQELLTELRK